MLTGIICALTSVFCVVCGISDWRQEEVMRTILNILLAMAAGLISAASFAGIFLL